MFKKLSMLALFGFATCSSALTLGPCQIKEIFHTQSADSDMVVKMACPGSSMPSCSAGNTDSVTFDATTPAGQIQSQMIVAAFMAKKDVRISVSGACVGNLPKVYSVKVY